MKHFAFSLERVLEFRRMQAERERTALEQLCRRQAVIATEREALIAEELSLRGYGAESAAERQARADYLLYLRDRQRKLERQSAELQKQVELQRTVVMQSERRCDLLEKLKQRRQETWQQDFDKELEELAGDSFRARLHAGRSRS